MSCSCPRRRHSWHGHSRPAAGSSPLRPPAPVPHWPRPGDGVLDVVARPAEQAHLHGLLDRNAAVHWDRLLFSAKEAAYKAWFPLTGHLLEFDEVEVTISGAGTLTARVLAPGPVTSLRGGGPPGTVCSERPWR